MYSKIVSMGLVILVMGAILGCLLALWAITVWVERNPLESAQNAPQAMSAWCGLSNANTCEVLADNSYWINK